MYSPLAKLTGKQKSRGFYPYLLGLSALKHPKNNFRAKNKWKEIRTFADFKN